MAGMLFSARTAGRGPRYRAHKGLEAACASCALPLLCAKRFRLFQLIYTPNNVMELHDDNENPESESETVHDMLSAMR